MKLCDRFLKSFDVSKVCILVIMFSVCVIISVISYILCVKFIYGTVFLDNSTGKIDGSSTLLKPLYLTSYIESGNITEGRLAAKVKPFAGNVSSYSGYFTVNKKYNSNLFFWFFPRIQQWKSSPLVLWLQGGPGASSMYGLFSENGPYVYKNGVLNERYYSWTSDFNVIYIDNPVGTGYSFTNSTEGYAHNEMDVGDDLYEAIRQFLLLFPELKKNAFVLTGESYAGKYVPALAHSIHLKNPTADLKINLFGLFIGNPTLGKGYMLDYDEYLSAYGLIDDTSQYILKKQQNLIDMLIKSKKWLQAADEFGKTFYESEAPYGTLFYNLTGIGQHFHVLLDKGTPSHIENFLNLDSTKGAIHVGPVEWTSNPEVYSCLKEDLVKSMLPWVQELLEHYRVLIYVGQLDIINPYFLVEKALLNLEWSGAYEYFHADRHILRIDQYIAGYYKSAKGLTEVLIRNAGHMVPENKPQWARRLLKKFVNKEFDT